MQPDHESLFFTLAGTERAKTNDRLKNALPKRGTFFIIGCAADDRFGCVMDRGEVSEWLRGTPGKRVRLNGPAGSSPALSAIFFWF